MILYEPSVAQIFSALISDYSTSLIHEYRDSCLHNFFFVLLKLCMSFFWTSALFYCFWMRVKVKQPFNVRTCL